MMNLDTGVLRNRTVILVEVGDAHQVTFVKNDLLKLVTNRLFDKFIYYSYYLLLLILFILV